MLRFLERKVCQKVQNMLCLGFWKEKCVRKYRENKIRSKSVHIEDIATPHFA